MIVDQSNVLTTFTTMYQNLPQINRLIPNLTIWTPVFQDKTFQRLPTVRGACLHDFHDNTWNLFLNTNFVIIVTQNALIENTNFELHAFRHCTNKRKRRKWNHYWQSQDLNNKTHTTQFFPDTHSHQVMALLRFISDSQLVDKSRQGCRGGRGGLNTWD